MIYNYGIVISCKFVLCPQNRIQLDGSGVGAAANIRRSYQV